VLVSRHAFQISVELKSDLKDFVRTLTEVLEEVDPYTRHHSVRVATYSVRLARGLRRPEREVEEIEYAALVHDLGKIGPQHQYILQKPGSLSHEEQRTLRAHPAAGAEIVGQGEDTRARRRDRALAPRATRRPGLPVRAPLGRRADRARILNVADAFDAMTSDRPYRRALPWRPALRSWSAAPARSSTTAWCSACSGFTARTRSRWCRALAARTCSCCGCGRASAARAAAVTMRYRDAGVDVARSDAIKDEVIARDPLDVDRGGRPIPGGFAG
jgi:hypothetical protein